MSRWTPNRKAALLDDIRDGLRDRAAEMRAHDISEDEMREWERDYARGRRYLCRAPGLRLVTRNQRAGVQS